MLGSDDVPPRYIRLLTVSTSTVVIRLLAASSSDPINLGKSLVKQSAADTDGKSIVRGATKPQKSIFRRY